MNITAANLGWLILAALAASYVLASIQEWFEGQYEVTRRGFRFTVARRWYGARAWVVLRDCKDDDEPERFRVLQVDTEDRNNPPWLKVGSVDFADDEDGEPFWGPVTDFYPEAVRRLSPWICRYNRLRVPVLFAYKPLPSPAGYMQDGAS
jgi:hypothetical protein